MAEEIAPPLTTRLRRTAQRLMGRAPHDIQLPRESRRDPRLPPTLGGSLRKAAEGAKTLKSLSTPRSSRKR